MSPFELLLEDVGTELDTWDRVALYRFSWFLRGLDAGLSEPEIESLCHRAYDEVVRQRDVHLEWYDWPPVDGAGRRAEAGTPLDFDINSTGTISTPFLALVPDTLEGTTSP